MNVSDDMKINTTFVKDLPDTLAPAPVVKMLYQAASTHTELSPSMCNRLASNSKVQQAKFRQIRYGHDMYEFALLHAVQDSLEATQLISHNVNSWLLAGECLAELRKLKESNQYYHRALEIDPSMKETLINVMEKNRCGQEFMDTARANGFSGDTLRLALDVAA
jgi:tetratricopeptide (TPR) repeat protein